MDSGLAARILTPGYEIWPASAADIAGLYGAGTYPADAAALAAAGAWTLWRDGAPIAASGLTEVWRGRGLAWFLAGPDVTVRDWREITRRIAEGIADGHAAGLWRIEVSVADGHAAGHRWARRLGFALESLGPARGYLPNGADAWIYAHIDEEQLP